MVSREAAKNAKKGVKKIYILAAWRLGVSYDVAAEDAVAYNTFSGQC